MAHKILTVVGARPQFIKAAAFSRALKTESRLGARLVEHLVHTGQHYDANMSDVFFDELAIPKPSASLGVGGGAHGQATGRMLEGLEAAMIDIKPDMVLVYGDTNSTLAGALAAAKLNIPIAHVEAGLRSYNRRMPEEINRVVSDHVSTLLMCPSDHAAKTLAGEGVVDGVSVVGDFMYDVYKTVAGSVETCQSPEPYALLTLHRAETTDDPNVLGAYLEGVGKSKIRALFPIHPRTRKALERYGMSVPDNVDVIDPLGYPEIVSALKGSSFVMTDSGGLQKEAYFAGRRCLTFRTETEWVELTRADVNRLVEPDPEAVAAQVAWARQDDVGADAASIYGDGDASVKTAQLIVDWLDANGPD